MVLLPFLHRVLTGRLAADRHPLERRSGRSQTSIFNFLFSFMPFFLLRPRKRAKKKGACLPAKASLAGAGRPLKRRGAAFPRTASVENTGDVALKPLQAFPDDVAGRTRAEKPLPHHRTLDRNLQGTVRRCSCALERLQIPRSPPPTTP